MRFELRRSALRPWLAPLCLLLGALMARPALAQQAVNDFSAGAPNGTYTFASRTPKTFAELVRPGALGAAEPAQIVGHLFLPAGDGKVPAVVLVHGSGGIYDAMLDFWPRQLNGAGVAVLALDMFGPRGVKSTAEDQSQVPFAADVADAYAALRLMASHPRVDAQRIAIMGFSRGGTATWRSALERVIATQGGVRFAAHIPVYSGGCTGGTRVIVRPGVFSKAPMLWIHGDADDYAPIGPCQEYAGRIRDAGTPVDFLVLPGAMHKFDADDPRRVFIRGAQRALATCPLEMDVDTLASFNRDTGQRLQGAAYQDVLRTQCGALGAHVEGSRRARDEAARAVLAFLARVFPR